MSAQNTDKKSKIPKKTAKTTLKRHTHPKKGLTEIEFFGEERATELVQEIQDFLEVQT